MSESETWPVPPGVLDALAPPKPADEIDELIASIGSEWPIRTASYAEVLTDTRWSFDA